MQPWAEAVLVGCAVVLTAALTAAALALRRTMRRVEAVLIILEQELRPLVGQAHGLTDELRELTREGRHELARVGEITGHLEVVAEGLGRIVVGLAGLSRVGHLIGLAAGLRRGVDVFVHRLRKEQGDHDGN